MYYDNMVRRNKELSREKTERALTAIRTLLSEKEPVCVAVLVKKTGLSREFFYKNEKVREAIINARKQQDGLIYQRPQKAVFDKAMAAQLEILKKQLEKVTRERDELKAHNDKLQKALKKKELNLIRNI